MYKLEHHFSLKNHNTFGIAASARYFLSISSIDDLKCFISEQQEIFGNEKRLIIGGGSNLLFVNDFEGLVISPDILGIKVLKKTPKYIDVEVGAGENWDGFVDFCVKKGWGGVENLSLIPGNVGASPVQNIGAYGIEVESVIQRVHGFDFETLQSRSFSHAECEFAYRDSLFKKSLLNRFLVTSVVFRLNINYLFKLGYGALMAEVENIGETNLENIRCAVISIRESKLPNPEITGNAGSFFKNPLVANEMAENLKVRFPDIPLYNAGENTTKIAAGWLIEKSGWKGKSFGNAAVHDKQALVLINKGHATGKEIFQLSEKICNDVFEKFGVLLEREVNVIG